jgi:hypothetical protein
LFQRVLATSVSDCNSRAAAARSSAISGSLICA